MIDFIDETSEQEGTPINRANMIGVQGFEGGSITYGGGKIKFTNNAGHVLTVAFTDNGYTETFTGNKTVVKTTKRTKNGVEVTLS